MNEQIAEPVMIESLLSTPQAVVSWFWGGVVSTVPMPWRGSLAAALLAYLLRPLIRVGAPWLLIGVLSLVRGVCWATPRLTLFVEGMASNLLDKAGIKFTRALGFFSYIVVRSFARIDNLSRSLINKAKSPGGERRPFRLRWVILAAVWIPVIFYSTLSTRGVLDVVPPSLAWWHSFEHFLLSGEFLPHSGQKHVKHTFKVNDGCLAENSCMLNEALKFGKVSKAELRLDNPDKFPSLTSISLLEKSQGNWLNQGRRSSLVGELLSEPAPTLMAMPGPISTMANDAQTSRTSSPKPVIRSVSILVPVRRKAVPSTSPPTKVFPTPDARQ